MTGLLDTSVFAARESGRPLSMLPDEGRVSVITVAELRIGVLVADVASIRGQRMRTLTEVEALEPLPVDDAAARAFAEIVADSRRRGKRPNHQRQDEVVGNGRSNLTVTGAGNQIPPLRSKQGRHRRSRSFASVASMVEMASSPTTTRM